MISLLKKAIKNEKIYRAVPSPIKKLARKLIPDYYFIEGIWAKDNPWIGTPYEWEGHFNNGPTVGIIYDFAHYHAYYISACHELQINYKVLKLHVNDWIDVFKNSGCDLFFVWPSVYSTVWKVLFDERLYFLNKKLGKTIYPTWEELFIYESKKRVRDLLIIEQIPHPQTWVFYTQQEALQFVKECELPLVFKTDLGASSHGVEIVRKRSHAASLVKKCFGQGYIMDRGDQRDRRWGYVMFQKYYHVKHEWRIVRVGETYFSRLKHKKGDFFSGSGKVSWAEPPMHLLDKTKEIMDLNKFTSAAIDYFETETGEFLVNEVQAMFGAIEKVNTSRNSEAMGCYKLENGQWKFTAGYYYDNACANLRIQWAMNNLAQQQ